jgi:hypothetical protein
MARVGLKKFFARAPDTARAQGQHQIARLHCIE